MLLKKNEKNYYIFNIQMPSNRIKHYLYLFLSGKCRDILEMTVVKYIKIIF